MEDIQNKKDEQVQDLVMAELLQELMEDQQTKTQVSMPDQERDEAKVEMDEEGDRQYNKQKVIFY